MARLRTMSTPVLTWVNMELSCSGLAPSRNPKTVSSPTTADSTVTRKRTSGSLVSLQQLDVDAASPAPMRAACVKCRRGVLRDTVGRMTTMVSFRVEDEDVERVDEWARRLRVDRTTLLRDAVTAYLARLTGEHDAAVYQAQPLSEEELALAS